MKNNLRKKISPILLLERTEFRRVKFETSGGIQVETSKKGVKLNLRKKRLYTELQIEESAA